MDQQWNNMDRNFGHSEIKWEIGNYYVLRFFKEWIIISPEFHVRGRAVTMWRMMLRKTLTSRGTCCVFFQLQQMPYETLFEKTFGDCVLYIRDKFGSWVSLAELNMPVDSFSFEIQLNNMHLNPINLFHSDNLYLKCELLINVYGVKESKGICNDLGIKILSEDLLRLYESCEDSDVKLEIGEINTTFILAHKAILSCRNRKFNKMISSNETSNRFIIHRHNCHTACDQVIRFLYTANMEYSAYHPMISVYKIASLYDIRPIMAYYAPDELTLYSTIHVEKFNTLWTINNFFSRKEHCLETPLVTNETMDARWRLKLYPKGVENDAKYVDLFFEIEGGMMKIAWVELFFMNADDEVLLKRINGRIADKDLFEEKMFTERETLKNYLLNENLRVGFRLRMASSRSSSEWEGPQSDSVGTSVTFCEVYSEQRNFAHLSEDMSALYQRDKFRNFNFLIGREIYFAHRGILSVRCPSLYNRVKTCVPFDCGKPRPETIGRFLSFIYSCKYDTLSLDDAFDLYNVAKEFKVMTLEESLTDNLLKSLTGLNTDERIKVYDFANLNNIRKLKLSAQRLIENADNNIMH